MANFKLKIQARKLRSQGKSVKDISVKLGIAKSTASLWVRDIILSIDQLEQLTQRKIKGAEKGRLISALKQKHARLEKIQKFNQQGKQEVGILSPRELLLTGIALYWAEGSKKDRQIVFCNSDPNLVNIMIIWLKKCLKIPHTTLMARVGINQIHKKRDREVKDYWSKATNIPLIQFYPTSFKKVKNVKTYENFNEHYGTLAVKALKPGENYYKIMGLIEGLKMAG